MPRGVVYTLRSVREARVASSHTLRVYYIQRGCLLCLFSCKAVEGRETEQAEVKHPRFLFVVIHKFNTCSLWVLANCF